MSNKLPIRETYTVKTLLNDLKKIKLTPGALYTVGSEVIYHEWQRAIDDFGEDNSVAIHLEELLAFLQSDYERRLLEGELRRKTDTPTAAINSFLKDTSAEFQSYVLQRSGEFISGVLRAAQVVSQREIDRFERMEKRLSAELEEKPNDPELWNQLRLVLWVLGRHDEASFAYKEAKRLGWEKRKSRTVAI